MTKCDSLQITLDLPSGAASRLAELAKAGDDVLKDLGILSLQVEGGQVISIRLSEERTDVAGPSWRRCSSSPSPSNYVQEFLHPASERPLPTTTGKRRQVLINPNTGHLEDPGGESSSSSSPESSPLKDAAAASDRALKLKLKLPPPELQTAPSNASAGLKRPSSYQVYQDGARKIPKLILSMKDKTVKMAEKASSCSKKPEADPPDKDTKTNNNKFKCKSPLDASSSNNNSNAIPSNAFPSPSYLQQSNSETSPSLGEEPVAGGGPAAQPHFRKIKKGTKAVVKNNNNDRVASWTKAYNADLINEPNTESWKEVLDSRVKPLASDADLDMDYAPHHRRLSESQKSSVVVNGFDKECLIKQSAEGNNKPPNHSSSASGELGEDTHGQLGEDSGIESMDALSEKSPNQGDGEDRDCKDILPPPPPPHHEQSDVVLLPSEQQPKSAEQSSSSVCEAGDSKILSAAAAASSIKPSSSVPIGAKMVPVKLVTVSGEGNLRLVRVSPVKSSSSSESGGVSMVGSHGGPTRTVVIKSSMLKAAAAGNPSFFNPSLISKISSSSLSTPANPPPIVVESSKVPPVSSASSSTVCLFPLKTKENHHLPPLEDKDESSNGFSIYKPTTIGKDAIQQQRQAADASSPLEDKSGKEAPLVSSVVVLESLTKTNLIKSGSLSTTNLREASSSIKELPSEKNKPPSSEALLKDV